MCDSVEKSVEKSAKKSDGFRINFNQDYTSIAIISSTGYKLFTLSSNNHVDEIFASKEEDTKIAERLFSSSLVVVVTTSETNKLKVCHFKKGTEICNYSYPADILSVKLNRSRLIVSLETSIYIHNIRDMKLLHSIHNIPLNRLGLCSLSLYSHLAYPVSLNIGELQVFDAGNLITRLKIKAHNSNLCAMDFSSTGTLIATASVKGTVIRVFCVKNGEKCHEFRRGLKRQVEIASLKFSFCNNYLCVTSNTSTVHIFKIMCPTVESTERRRYSSGSDFECLSETEPSSETGWLTMGFITKAVSSYFPSQVRDVFVQDRAFATVQLNQSGLKYECAITKINKEDGYGTILIACEDGFLYVYDFKTADGGPCKLRKTHDLRNTLHDITEIEVAGDEPMESVNMENNTNMSSSYAGVLKGKTEDTSELDKCRELNNAVDSPAKSIFDAVQFPPIHNLGPL